MKLDWEGRNDQHLRHRKVLPWFKTIARTGKKVFCTFLKEYRRTSRMTMVRNV